MGDRIDLAAIRARVEIAGATELRAMVAALCDDAARERRIWNRELEGLTSAVMRIEAERDALRAANKRVTAECDAMRESIAGRTTAPTDAEVEAHAKAGGSWLVGARAVFTMKDARWARELCGRRASLHDECPPGWPAYRWLALDASGAPCAWPVVTP